MAILNIKNFPDELAERLRHQAARSRRSMAQEVIYLLSRALDTPEPLALSDLRGLGRERWHKIDATAHVDEERRSWE